MKKNIKFTILTNGDDWYGLYKNGSLVEQGNFHDVFNVFERKKRKHVVLTITLDADYADKLGNFPESLKDVDIAEIWSAGTSTPD